MKAGDLGLSSPEENLACDEVLLDLAETGALEGTLRFWEPTQRFVVLGYANHAASEVNLQFCERSGIRVLRRCSGGGAVLQGPGCLNYSLILPISSDPALGGISATNEYILRRHQRALQELLHIVVERQGLTDLAIGGRKFCGNSQRRRKDFVLFHGCFLLHADIGLMERALPFPSHSPEYRRKRSHTEFLMNLGIRAQTLKEALCHTWGGTAPLLPEPPLDQIRKLARERYHRPEWNLKF